MSSGDPFGMIVALGLIFAVVMVTWGLLWVWDQITASALRGRELDRCLTCGKLLRYLPTTGAYRPHRCRHY